jgi:hypothetical protein
VFFGCGQKLERRFRLENEQLTFHLLNFRHDKTARLKQRDMVDFLRSIAQPIHAEFHPAPFPLLGS